MLRFADDERAAHDGGFVSGVWGATGAQAIARGAHGEGEPGDDGRSPAAAWRAQHMRVASREDHQVPRGERFGGAVRERDLALAAGDDVHAAEPSLIEADPEWDAEFEPPVVGAFEAQFPQHQAQDIHANEPSLRARRHVETDDVVSRTITHRVSAPGSTVESERTPSGRS
jgi:hypothetical protein